MIYKYRLVATGGTFDRFHKGHEELLSQAFAVSEKVIIGVTSDNWVKQQNKILKEIVLPYNKRVLELKNLLKSKGFLGREIIEKLEDIYGPTVINGEVEAIVCTRETRKGANRINLLRKSKGASKLDIVECSFITSSDHYHISSTRLRLGQINREGQILTNKEFGLVLPDKLRGPLAKPVGTLYPDISSVLKTLTVKPMMLISVGDMVYHELVENRISPSIAVIDLRIGRKKLVPPYQRQNYSLFDYVVKNKHGTVSPILIKTVKKAVKNYLKNRKALVIKVIGEEDLSVIPVIITAPLQSVILYGQPEVNGVKSGVVRVIVTEEKKKWVVELLRKFN